LKSIPARPGAIIPAVAPEGAPAKAGIQAGDILTRGQRKALRDQPGDDQQRHQGCYLGTNPEAAWYTWTSSATTRHVLTTFTYTRAAGSRRKLQQQGVEIDPSSRRTAPPVFISASDRPVIADEMAPLALTKAQGLVVVSVENGGLADTMGVLAETSFSGERRGFRRCSAVCPNHSQRHDRSFRVWRKGQTVELTVREACVG